MTVASRQRARLLLVAPHNSYRIAPYIEAANRLDIDFLVASEGKHSLVGAVADGLHIDLSDPQQALERLLEAAAEHPFAGVVGSDDATIEMASRLAAQLNLPHNPPQAAVISRRKDLARATLADAGVPVPKHWLLDLRDLHEKQLASIEFPADRHGERSEGG
ncbi:hypothetical protein [Candidatus Reidiella endopervernicosa]|uniref:BL00235/CARNS1 N-terminal domain-containing protein n=1 Tax=Candidatus Reidiella endopervernicosa TaxID=2738883 RepID=A0A6N0HUW1_9GAMM|nr:hypothetical protein [Candidatus Reidiella endopervernicosa]QKQ26037.1 hypothetical protein HUE57_06865 [Candidatus Reidiella endopervernicosa]